MCDGECCGLPLTLGGFGVAATLVPHVLLVVRVLLRRPSGAAGPSGLGLVTR